MSTTVATTATRSWLLYAMLALVGMSFSATGPVTIIVSAAQQAGLSLDQTSSWLFAVLAINGAGSLLVSGLTRQPLVFLWTIPGTVLIAPMVLHYGFAAVVGTYLTCAVVMAVLAITNWIAVVDRMVPMPVVMAMICGLFLKYAVAILHSTLSAPWIGGSMLLVFFGLLGLERRNARLRMPPIIGALVAGIVVMLVGGVHLAAAPAGAGLATPTWQWPRLDLHCELELLVPLLITMIFVQNAQGVAVLRSAGYSTSLRLVTLTSAGLTALCAPFGAVPSVLAGPCNAILVSDGEGGQHYKGALVVGAMSILIGVFASAFAWLFNNLPPEYLSVLAGLALFGVLEKSFIAAFTSPLPTSALVVFVVTLSDISLLGLGSAFWGVMAGCLVATVAERRKAQ